MLTTCSWQSLLAHAQHMKLTAGGTALVWGCAAFCCRVSSHLLPARPPEGHLQARPPLVLVHQGPLGLLLPPLLQTTLGSAP